MIRLFAGLEAPWHIAEGLKACQLGVRGARWTAAENLHITLRFFGEASEPAAEVLDDHLMGVQQSPFDLRLAGVGAFGADTRAGALYAAPEASEPLARLAAKCERAAQKAGFEPERRAYRPHMTLAYLDDQPGPEVAAWLQANSLLRSDPWRVMRFFLYSSRLGRAGPRYEIEREYLLT